MEESKIAIIIGVLALCTALYALFAKAGKADVPLSGNETISRPLQLQAYERLVTLCERMSLPNLISRVNQPSLSAREMQLVLVESIRQEFEYNISQQVYVSTLSWDAVRNLRDQTVLVINQISNGLEGEAKANDLNKRLLEVILDQHGKALHTIVLETLNYEAKQLMV